MQVVVSFVVTMFVSFSYEGPHHVWYLILQGNV